MMIGFGILFIVLLAGGAFIYTQWDWIEEKTKPFIDSFNTEKEIESIRSQFEKKKEAKKKAKRKKSEEQHQRLMDQISGTSARFNKYGPSSSDVQDTYRKIEEMKRQAEARQRESQDAMDRAHQRAKEELRRRQASQALRNHSIDVDAPIDDIMRQVDRIKKMLMDD